ncbi:glycerol kinase-like isoform X2 [Gordionus sp. m RMFG-2023]|uniref:glycerol kinase-like isoform X2 n=1 Tax=Gordionus sp. m RMFG-2023 TaxID=3053472 RepID=UPI0031FE028B
MGRKVLPSLGRISRVWQDNRTSELLEGLMKANGVKDKDKECLKDKCGLPLSTYFSAGKIKWLITNVPQVSEAVQDERCLFGTVDSWIIWNFNRNNGVGKGDLHITDVTNASRTMLMNIATLEWDEDLCKFFGIPMHTLPEIRSSSEIYSRISLSPHLKDVPISGILGDQQAALVGQRCLLPGSVKNTYGTGCFLLYNTGTKLIYSKHGLLTTVAYKLGPGGVTHYALEGSVAIAGAAITWLVKSLNLMKDEHETESLAKSVPNTNGCYFVPAFSGLYAPYWDPNARGIICGLSHATNKGHIVRATLEAISFQTKEILDAMNKDTLNSHDIKSLHVDGGMATNKTLMQIQSDIAGIDIIRHEMLENTALGAAMAAANAKGIDLYDIEGAQAHYFEFTKFQPNISLPERQEKYTMWKKAVRRSLYWEGLQDIYQD